ncbi:hypothetical protein QZH41_019152, partial [Actinostola sp. cb2023]
YPKYSLLGWSDGGITAMIFAANNPGAVEKMVVWGANASVTKEDLDMYEKARDIDKWNPRMRNPLEGYPKYSLLGWSDGGITAMIFAANNPGAVEKMVVWGVNALVTKEDGDMYEKARDIDKWNPRMRKPLEARYGVDGLRSMWKKIYWLDAIDRFFNGKGGNIYQEFLPKIRCPTLIVHGQKDPMVPQFHADYLHKNIAGSMLHLMPEGQHNLHLRYAEEFNEIVSKFLKE